MNANTGTVGSERHYAPNKTAAAGALAAGSASATTTIMNAYNAYEQRPTDLDGIPMGFWEYFLTNGYVETLFSTVSSAAVAGAIAGYGFALYGDIVRFDSYEQQRSHEKQKHDTERSLSQDQAALSGIQGKCKQILADINARHDELELQREYMCREYDKLLQERECNVSFDMSVGPAPSATSNEHHTTLGVVSSAPSGVQFAEAAQAQLFVGKKPSDVFAAYDEAKQDLGLDQEQQANLDRRYGIVSLKRDGWRRMKKTKSSLEQKLEHETEIERNQSRKTVNKPQDWFSL